MENAIAVQNTKSQFYLTKKSVLNQHAKNEILFFQMENVLNALDSLVLKKIKELVRYQSVKPTK